MENINLICFPFAGGNRYSYSSFKDYVPKGFEFHTYELPGRGVRFREPLLLDMKDVVEDAMTWMSQFIHQPYAIYGHSLGALLGYLMMKEIQRSNVNPPLHLFFTGSEGPSVQNRREMNYKLPKDEFFEKLRELGGCPPDILKDATIMEFFEPIIRADFQVVEEYIYEPSMPFDIPITCFYGTEEDMTHEDVLSWSKESTMEVEVRRLPGDHFFINQFIEEIVNFLITRTIRTIKTRRYSA